MDEVVCRPSQRWCPSTPSRRRALHARRESLRLELFVGVGGSGAFFDRHIFEFAGVEDFAAIFTFHVFCVFVSRYDLHA
jgi:hypothetical protein